MHRKDRRVMLNLAVLGAFFGVALVFDSLLPDDLFWPVLAIVAVLYGLSLKLVNPKRSR